MNQFTPLELQNWLAIYAATFACCVIALTLSTASVGYELYRERIWSTIDVRSPRTMLLFVPKIWWRWQRRYFLSTPVTLAIVSWFGATLSWS
ncbi:hypothetical protein Q4F19_08510 [Sphingomonas sp. BIUV-7]|uniref:Uncharacterized protein n=1 Tax=Sphingomonas natans TaxID=3063330 RepID=A0ABT8Y7X7_9SPHN|nr:hypothetical protein [Sphingomonas sp. BIUV-7]MDO6414421.1 hypothetical protein [Sphingomonas sp. BIUV-7]